MGEIHALYDLQKPCGTGFSVTFEVDVTKSGKKIMQSRLDN